MEAMIDYYTADLQDVTSPSFNEISMSSSVMESGGYVNITANITDDTHVETAWLNITYPDNSTMNTTMNVGSYYYNQTFTMPGTYYYYIWTVDSFGNTNKSRTYSFTIEPSLPPSSRLQVTQHSGSYISSVSNFRLQGVDNSGLWRVHYRIDNGQIKSSELNDEMHFQINSLNGYQPGKHTIEYWATDLVGNEECHKVVTYCLDVEGPNVLLDFGGPKYMNITEYYITSSTSIILAAEDDGCGVNGIIYKVDNGNWHEYTEPITIREEGVHWLVYSSTDNLGNRENAKLKVVHVDNIPPESWVEYDGLHHSDDNTIYVTSNTVLNLHAIDTGVECCGLKEIMYQLDGQGWNAYAGPFTVDREGKHVLEYYGIDNLGNHLIQSQNIVVDDSPPETTSVIPQKGYLHLFGRPIMPTMLGQTIVIGSIDVTFKGTDASGIDTVNFYVDGDLQYTAEETPFVWTWDTFVIGYRTLELVATDNLGHSTTEKMTVLRFSL